MAQELQQARLCNPYTNLKTLMIKVCDTTQNKGTRFTHNRLQDGGFFIFADISVRHEGFFKLKFTLFKIIEQVSHKYTFFIAQSTDSKNIFFHGCTTEPMYIVCALRSRMRSKCTRQRVRMAKHTRVYMTR